MEQSNATAQDYELEHLYRMDKKLKEMKVGGKLKVSVNGVSDQCELHCVEISHNPRVLRFAMWYYGVATGKELVVSNALNKWEFKA